jgi:hypothetical protein
MPYVYRSANTGITLTRSQYLDLTEAAKKKVWISCNFANNFAVHALRPSSSGLGFLRTGTTRVPSFQVVSQGAGHDPALAMRPAHAPWLESLLLGRACENVHLVR